MPVMWRRRHAIRYFNSATSSGYDGAAWPRSFALIHGIRSTVQHAARTGRDDRAPGSAPTSSQREFDVTTTKQVPAIARSYADARYGVELLGTFLLVFIGVGSAIAGRTEGGVTAVALTFGFVLVALAYTFGPVSGCHVNPAVTLGMLLSGRLSVIEAVGYWIAQLVGATVAALALWGLTRWGGVTDQTGALGTNGYGAHINLGGTIVLEIVVTFVLVLVVLVVSERAEKAAPVAIGLALLVGNLIAIPLDGASINPARSFGPALFEGGSALSQLWVFILAPLAGGALAAVVGSLSSPHTRLMPRRPAE